MNKIAIIDMGTNTFHLLVAETGDGGYQVRCRDHVAVKIGKSGINEGIISEMGIKRAVEAMLKFKNTLDGFAVENIYAFGTSALRNASNGQALLAEIQSLTGISVHVINGDTEAELIYYGVKAALDLGKENNLIMDIGAGSVEFIIGNRDSIFWKQSFEIGGQRLLEKFQKHDPISGGEISTLDTFFHQSLKPLLEALVKYQPTTLVGSSGSFDTLGDIYCIRNGIPRTFSEKELPLSHDGFYEIYQELITRKREERMQIEGMIEMRVDMIVVACCLIRYILDVHCFKRIRVSTYSLKEGALSKLAMGISDF